MWFARAAAPPLVLPNLLRNSAFAGAQASPETLPTYMGMTSPLFGVTRDITAKGTDLYDHLDVRWSGTGSSTSVATAMQFDSNTAIAAAAGSRFCGSLWASLVAGSLANVTGLKLRVRYNDSGGAFLAIAETSIAALTASPQRFQVAAGAAPANTAYVLMQIVSNWAVAAVDMTLRLQGPMLNTGDRAAVYAATTA